MVDLEYVKKRKRKKLAGILGGIASMGIAVFILVSFLGRFVGTFTVSLNTGAVKLALYDNIKYENPTSYIKIDSLPPFDLYSFSKLPDASQLDNEKYGIDLGTKRSSRYDESIMYFFKYTFFVRNEANVAADYDVKINLTKNEPSSNGTYLDNILRIMVYQNDPNTDEHKYTVYAKRSEVINYIIDGDQKIETSKEYLSDPSKNEFAEEFESRDVVATIPDYKLEKGDVKRYTIVAWLDGYDPQCHGEAPEGANLKLGVTINAYENEQ